MEVLLQCPLADFTSAVGSNLSEFECGLSSYSLSHKLQCTNTVFKKRLLFMHL